MTAPAYCTLDDIKRYLSLDQDPTTGAINSVLIKDDALLNIDIPAFCDAINDHCQWRFEQETVVAKVFSRSMATLSRVQIDREGNLTIKTNSPTIQSVTALAYKMNWTSGWINIDVTTVVRIDPLSPDEHPTETSYVIGVDQSVGWLASRYPYRPIWLQASYVGGYATTPPVIRTAALEWISHDYRLRQYIPTMSVGFVGMPNTKIMPSRIPEHIAQLLDNWQKKAS